MNYVEGEHYRVNEETDCWEWLRSRNRKGYPTRGGGTPGHAGRNGIWDPIATQAILDLDDNTVEEIVV